MWFLEWSYIFLAIGEINRHFFRAIFVFIAMAKDCKGRTTLSVLFRQCLCLFFWSNSSFFWLLMNLYSSVSDFSGKVCAFSAVFRHFCHLLDLFSNVWAFPAVEGLPMIFVFW